MQKPEPRTSGNKAGLLTLRIKLSVQGLIPTAATNIAHKNNTIKEKLFLSGPYFPLIRHIRTNLRSSFPLNLANDNLYDVLDIWTRIETGNAKRGDRLYLCL
jgi:hypothetical protein